MSQRFFWTISIVICDLNAWRQIILCDEHEMGTFSHHNGFRHQVAISWMVYQTTKFTSLWCSVDAMGKIVILSINICTTRLIKLITENSPVLLFIVFEVVHVTAHVIISSITCFSLICLLHWDKISNVFDDEFASFEESRSHNASSFLVKHSHLQPYWRLIRNFWSEENICQLTASPSSRPSAIACSIFRRRSSWTSFFVFLTLRRTVKNSVTFLLLSAGAVGALNVLETPFSIWVLFPS